ncbi:hypothetical protein EJ08DRAFT_630487 [Tothia fuscella]|uniref:Uncharacterized protein n=1 Tax=Tothia fuscella TaxID=1048955 RepID=A0A9P4NVU3_9PEZI|nr:hypothetical protein EJ08DRAFT_630487 [Tothia fuscella]
MNSSQSSEGTFKAPLYPESEASIILPKRGASPSSSISSLPYRRSNQSLSTVFASTSNLTHSARSSGTSTPVGAPAPASTSSPGPLNGTAAPVVNTQGRLDDPRNVLLRSFAPHVGVLASTDTEEILHQKGFPGGFLEIIRPFGESVPGKVNIRNGVGASTSWDDFGIHFTGLKDTLGSPRPTSGRSSLDRRTDSGNGRLSGSTARSSLGLAPVGGDVAQIEEVVDRHLAFAELAGPSPDTDYMNHKEKEKGKEAEVVGPKPPDAASPFYSLYLKRLLSALPMTPHETFSHPVACVIAISSRNPHPIEELRRLYNSTNNGDDRLPQWVNNEFLRYYVLVHNEDDDDISKSTALYEQMKRHFGLHCHLLRVHSRHCVPTDDDSKRLPVSEWISAAEELAEIQKREEADDDSDSTPLLFESDCAGIRTFVRELVVQSIIPSMERMMAQWNETVATRRRGLGGRLMSLSKRWTPFGSSTSRNASSPVPGSSNSNYDSLQGFYRPDAPEAVMRKLADYAFMLRDYKLAGSTYELLRTDFEADKAWKYYAGANEMAAVSKLLNMQAMTTKLRQESIDRMLEGATHSYIHRCNSPFYALRSLAMNMELLKLRGFSAADDAAEWAGKILHYELVGAVGSALFRERISACYTSRQGVGGMAIGARVRKAAFYSVLAADGFLKLGKTVQAEKCIGEATKLYGSTSKEVLAFDGMRSFLDELRESIIGSRLMYPRYEDEDTHASDEEGEPVVEEVKEELDKRVHRHSLIGVSVPLDPLGVGPAPMSPVRTRDDNPLHEDDKFS